MEIRQLRYFSTVVEAGSFTQAAGRLHLSQPPLSVAIGKLEAELGVSLLTRTPRGVEATSAGRYLLNAASRILSDVDDTEAALRRFGTGTAGAINFAAVPALVWHRVPRILRVHARVAPDVQLNLVDPPPWTAIDMLLQRAVDAAAMLVADHEGFVRRHRETLDVLDWGDVPLVGVLPLDDAPPEGTALPLQYFTGRTSVVPRRTAAVASLPEVIEETFDRHRIQPADVRTVETIQLSLPIIESGRGCAILPDADGASLARFDVAVRPLSPAAPPLRAIVATRRGGSRDELLRRLLETIANDAALQSLSSVTQEEG